MRMAILPVAAALAAAGLALSRTAPSEAPQGPGAAPAGLELAAPVEGCAPAGDEIDRLALLAGSDDPFAHQAAHALGKVSDPDAREAMRRLARGDQELVAGNALRALGRIADPRDLDLFLEVVETRPGTRSWHEAVRSLGRLRRPESLARLVGLLLDREAEPERLTILFALGESEDPRALPAIEGFLRGTSLTVAERAFAERAARQCGLEADR